MKALRSTFTIREQQARHIEDLERQLREALAERELLEQERDNALYEAERWHHRYLIASGQGGP